MTLKETLGFEFRDPSLLQHALTHRSYVNEREATEHNERLEFLGDAVVDLIVGEWLFHRFPDVREGELSQNRAALVRTESLAEFAQILGLPNLLRLGQGEESSGGRSRPTLLADAFEALIGAIYLDQGIETARAVIVRLLEPALERHGTQTKDAKSLLQEWSQAQAEHITPSYHVLSTDGPDHARHFVVEVCLGKRTIAHGEGSSIRRAEQAAAQAAMRILGLT